jgi:hypothetical protein
VPDQWLPLLLTGAASSLVTALVLVAGRRLRTRARKEQADDQATILVEYEKELRHLHAERDEARKAKEALAAQVDAHKARIQELLRDGRKYDRLRSRLAQSRITRTYLQPVLVVGPLGVGKTSLVRQWHVPWEHSPVTATQSHRFSDVPIYGFDEPEPMPHFVDPGIKVPVRAQLGLRLHDFPGEQQAQQKIGEIVREEAERLRRLTRKDLGLVVLCMFNAEEAHTGVQPETARYYNGDLFRQLRLLIAEGHVAIARLILVFNKADLLRAQRPAGAADPELLAECVRCFETTCQPLRGIVHPEKVCEVLTVLGRHEAGYRSEGAAMLKGEAARPLVEAFLGKSGPGGDAEPDGPAVEPLM